MSAPDREGLKRLRAVADSLSRELVERGMLIEAGWVALRTLSVPPSAPQVQLDEMRNAFFAGAQHLFGSLMSILDPNAEPTDADVARMGLISDELDRFIGEYSKRHGLI